MLSLEAVKGPRSDGEQAFSKKAHILYAYLGTWH